MAAVRARERIGLGPAAATACAFSLPVSIAAGFKRSPVRDGAVWAAQMWAYKNAFEMPADDEERLRRRAHFDYPIAVDRVIGAGTPPSQRLARRLRRGGHLSALDKALTFFYWTWEAEPHLAIGWIRWRRSEHFASAAMAAILLTEQDRRLGMLAWSYALGLAFVLVYLGEHYVTDLLGGLALALSVNAARQHLEGVAERILALGPGR